jgi:hypothetical protein
MRTEEGSTGNKKKEKKKQEHETGTCRKKG